MPLKNQHGPGRLLIYRTLCNKYQCFSVLVPSPALPFMLECGLLSGLFRKEQCAIRAHTLLYYIVLVGGVRTWEARV